MAQQTNLDRFFDVYEDCLLHCIDTYPDEYAYGPDTAKAIAAKFKAKVAAHGFGGINKDGHAFKMTCKKLGIKHTYKAMEAFVKQGGVA